MNRIVVKSKIGSDGILHLALPVGVMEAEKEVRVTVEPLRASPVTDEAEWHKWVESLAGTWQGDWERPPQGEYEAREPLS